MRRRPRTSIVGTSVAVLVLVTACRTRPHASPASIVLVTIDTLRADHVTSSIAPALTAFASDALVYDQVVTAAPLTLPAHASLLTGLDPPRHGVRDNQVYTLASDIPTYPALLKAQGYATAAFVSAVVLNRRYGLNRGFDVYDDEITGPERDGAVTVARAERWIDAAPRPFFVWIHLFEPHAPYRTGTYASEVTAADRALGTLFEHLRATRVWNDLVVSVTSDHGESLGEHGEQTHGFFLYDATLRIPWLLKAPHLAAGHVGRLARIVDEFPTIIDVAGVQGTAAPVSGRDGISLARAAHQAAPTEASSETFLPLDQFGWSPLLSLRTDRIKYIDAPSPELYDLDRDPAERRNVITERADDAHSLKRLLDRVERPPSVRSTSMSDPGQAEDLMSLGYLALSRPVAQTHADLPDPKSKLEVYNLTMRALELSERGDVGAALDAVTRAEALDPKVAQIEFLKGSLLGRVGRFSEAVGALQRALMLDPQLAPARYKLALAWLRLGHSDRAAAALRELLREQPDDFRGWHNLAAIAYSRGDLDDAEELERKALQIRPSYAEAWNTVGAIALIRRQPQAALDALTKATQYGPQNAQAFQNLALAFDAVGKPDESERAAARACELDHRLCHPR